MMLSSWNRLISVGLGLIIFTSAAFAQEGSATDPRRPLSAEGQTGSPNSDLLFFSPPEPEGCEITLVYWRCLAGLAISN